MAVYIVLGGMGFLFGYLQEWAPVRRVPGAKPLLGIAAGALLAFSLGMVSVQGARFWLPDGLVLLGGLLAPPVALLLLYSLFFELPFRGTYVRPGSGPQLVTTGTYALVRHPTVLWYGLLLLTVLLLTRSHLLLFALPFWLGLDILWAILQERFSLPRGFADYRRYRESTPMFVPNRASLRACLTSLRGVGAARAGVRGR